MSALLYRNNREGQDDRLTLTTQHESKYGEDPIDEEAARELLRRSLRRKYEVLALLSRAFA